MHSERYYQIKIREELDQRLRKNARYSLRSFSRALDIDAGTLSRILGGKKIPTPDLSKKILSHLGLNPKEEKLFLLSMAQAYEDNGVQRKKSQVKAILKNQSTPIQERDLTPEVFRIISDWHHYAILQLMQVEGFKSDARWIATQLGIQEMEVLSAISRLKELEMVEEVKGKLTRTAVRLTTGDLATTTPALRKRIKQITEKSLHSLENDPIAQRNHSTITMAIDPEQIPLAKEMIQEFMDQLCKTLQPKKKKVYELQINLFPLQRSEK
jgi:uncharacterized protein (TIGR02147 family)